MSDDSSANIAAARRDWKTEHLDAYLDSGGAAGHVVDLTDIRYRDQVYRTMGQYMKGVHAVSTGIVPALIFCT